MPYPNFHAARVRTPGAFERIRVLRTLRNGIMIYGGQLKSDPAGPSIAQSYRFPRTRFTPEQAKAWLKENRISFTKFEGASRG